MKFLGQNATRGEMRTSRSMSNGILDANSVVCANISVWTDGWQVKNFHICDNFKFIKDMQSCRKSSVRGGNQRKVTNITKTGARQTQTQNGIKPSEKPKKSKTKSSPIFKVTATTQTYAR